MKTSTTTRQGGFTLVEMMMALVSATIILAAVVASGVSLQKSFAAVEKYSTNENDQLRVLDYIAMDCRRAIRATVNGTTTPAVVNGSWTGGTVVNGVMTGSTWTLSSSSPQTLLLSLPVYYSSSAGAVNPPSLSTGSLTYGTGSVSVAYYQSGNNFNREVVIMDASGTVTSDTTTAIATNVSSFTVTPLDNTATDGTVSCNIMFFPTFSHMPGNGTWRSGVTNPDTAPASSIGSDGDWYVINTTATNQSTVGNVYCRAGGNYSLVQNVKATVLYCNTFLRNASGR